MKIIEPSVILMHLYDEVKDGLKRIEYAGRVCYNSLNMSTDNSYEDFIKKLIKKGHESPLEHCSITAKIITDRAIANEIVRHRIASYSQESTRYIAYRDYISVIKPQDIKSDSDTYKMWHEACENAEQSYLSLLSSGVKPEIARSVLPLCTATVIVVTYNIRQWRHFIKLRADKAAHPDMRHIAKICYEKLMQCAPCAFEDISNLIQM